VHGQPGGGSAVEACRGYEKFVGGKPVKVKQGYVKFLPEWTPVNLALSTGSYIGASTIDHVSVQVDSVETVMAQLARVKAAACCGGTSCA
jgi:hypothetical protein